LKGILS